MAKDREELSKILKECLGSEYVYFSPPANVQRYYPCIEYELEDMLHEHSNNNVYMRNDRYTLTAITRNPDDPVVKKIDNLPYCSMNRHYVADNLHHFVYTIFI